MSKWYVVGKVCGIVESLKVLGLLAIGFCAGVFAADRTNEREKKKHNQECDVYNQGWNDCRHCYANFNGEESDEYVFGVSEDAGTKEN